MSANSVCLILGGARRGEFETLLAQGVKLGLILDANSPANVPVNHQFILIEKFDFQKPATELAVLIDSISKTWHIEAVLNTREAYVGHHMAISRHLGLPSISEQVLLGVTNKTEMHNAFVNNIGEDSTALYARATSVEQLPAIVAKIGFPLILKPTNLAASLFVQKCDNMDELTSKFNAMLISLAAHYEKLGKRECAEPEIQLEEFLEGSLHSQDLIITENGEVYPSPIVDVITGKDLGLNDFHHFYRGCPSKLNEVERNIANELTKQGVQALSLHSCVAHAEFIYTKKGPKLLEIAARPGAHRNRVLEMTYDLSLNVQYYNNQKRQKIDCAVKANKHFAILTPFPRSKKEFLGLKDIDAIKKLDSYLSHEFRVSMGDMIGPAKEGFYSCFVLELSADSHAQLWKDIHTIQEMGDCFK